MISPLFLFLQYRISMAFLMAFQLLFLPLRYKKYISGIIAVGCMCLTGGLDYLYFIAGWGTADILPVTIAQIIIVQATAYLLSQYRDFRALFTGISSATFVLPGNIVSTACFAHKQVIWAALLTQAVIHLILLVLLVIVLRWHYLLEMETNAKEWKWLCIIPTLFYAVTYTMACWPNSIYERKENWTAAFLFLILMGVVYIMLIKALAQHHLDNDLERNNEFLETYARGLRREADMLRESEENLKVMRHDSRHVYQMIGAYLEEGKTEQIKELLEQMDAKLETLTIKRFCENIAINGVISGCEAKAKSENVAFACEADVPSHLNGVNEFELATVISNLLENAVYAAAAVENPENRNVTIQIFPVKEQLILEITNTFTGACTFSPSTGLPLSTKGGNHGYGLRSVKAYANKNHAVFRYSVEDGRFCVRLLTNI
ncbi:sensor histidine kinase [Ruminococcus sp. 5_1_39BFAA]|uniref:sensor histidine kinase n=1 Tax=Ruminococcus sp. 5_1_39BFAA TaxID=457412 RepID=UPI0035653933